MGDASGRRPTRQDDGKGVMSVTGEYVITDDGTGFRRDWLNVLRFRRPYVVTRNGFIVALAPTKGAARRAVRTIREEVGL